MPGTRHRSSALAATTPASPPKCASSRLRLAGPIPSISSRLDVRRARERAALVDGIRAQIRKIVALVTGPNAFDTGAVRRAVTTLAGDAVALKAQEPHAEDWLGDILEGARAVLDLVDRAEGDIMGTARQARRELEEIVSGPGFRFTAPPLRVEPEEEVRWSPQSAAE